MKYLKRNKGILFVLLISFLPLINLLNSGLPVAHDTLEHTARIASFYNSLSEGIIVPRWAGNLNWGFGHPIFMFLYPVPSYLTSVFHFIGFSYVDSLKILFAISYILSGAFIYLWIKNFLNERAAIVGAIIYLFAPYRFVDLYVRGAIGEHVAFMFIPITLLSILILYKSPLDSIKKIYIHTIFIALSFAGLILSHNAISLIFMPFLLFYILYLFYEYKSKLKIAVSFFSLILGFSISAFFWIPAYIEGKYTLRDIVTANVYKDRFVEIKDLIYSNWDYGATGEFTAQVGIIQISLVIISIIFFVKLFKKTDKQKYLYIGSLIFLIFSLFLITPYSNLIWEKITIIQKLQFPWRFLSMAVLMSSIISAFFIGKIKEKYQLLTIIVVTLIAIIPTINFWQAKAYKTYPDNFFEKNYPSTTDTGESSPIWSIRSMDKFPKANLEIIEGKGSFVEFSRASNYHEYVIDAPEKIRIKENTLYFPGWKIYDNYNLIENIEFQDPKNRGIMTFNLDKGIHNIILKFEDTKIRKFSNLISTSTIILLVIFPIFFITFKKIKINKLKW